MRFLGFLAAGGMLFAFPAHRESFVAGPEFRGESITVDLPAGEHMRNRGGSDGAGMCVMTSVEMAARWQGMEEFRGLRDWCARERGGAWPAKVENQLRRYGDMHRIAVPPHVQYEGPNPEIALAFCERTGRMACATYGYSPRYGAPIAHMVNCVKFSRDTAACLDNNFPGENSYEWMSADEFVRRTKHSGGSAWVFVWLTPPPPPIPHN